MTSHDVRAPVQCGPRATSGVDRRADEGAEGPSLQYRPVPNWGLVPHGMGFGGDATAVAVDSNDLVYVFNRGDDPIMVFTPDGQFLRAFGQGEFQRPHAIRIDADDDLFLIDDHAHTLQKRSKDGTLIFESFWERPAEAQSGRPFNQPTDVAIRPGTGELYVSDGYNNSRVHRLTPDGGYVSAWGTSGSHPGEFSLPHNLTFIDDDVLVVCDRENHRLQFFSPEGDWLDAWHAHHPSCVYYDRGRTGLIYVGEMPPRLVTRQMNVPGLGARIKVFTPAGRLVAEFGGPVKGTGKEHDRFVSPHGIAVDSSGAVYIAEVAGTNLRRDGEVPLGRELISLRKWEPVPTSGG